MTDVAADSGGPAPDFIRDASGPTTPRANTAGACDAVPARAQRLPAHRPRQVDLPQLRRWPQEFGGACNLRFDDTNPTKEEHEYVESIQDDVRWLGFDWGRARFTPPTISSSCTSGPRSSSGRARPTSTSSTPRQIRAVPRHADRAGHARARTATDRVEENLDLFAPHAGRRVPRRRARAARQDRHGVAQHEHARPGALPHPPRAPPPHRRRLVHLPDVRLRARPDRTPSRASRTRICTLEFEDHRPLYDWCLDAARLLGDRPAADRVRAAQPDLHGHEQAKLLAAGRRRGTSTAGTTRACPPCRACAAAATRPRRSAPSAAHRRRQGRTACVEIELLEHCVRDDLNRTCAAASWRCSSAQGGDRPTTPRARSRSSRRPTTPRTRRRARARCRSSRELYIERDDFCEVPPQEVLPALARAARCGCATPTSSRATRS